MPTARVNGTELYYEVHGEGEPLLCVMGLAADTLAWLPQVPAWSEAYKTVIFDNRDVGQSAYVAGDYAIADMAADTLALADELGLERFHLLGLSMGGMIAQEIALTAPERLRTLTLVVTFGGAGRWGAEKVRLWLKDADGRSHEDMVDELLLLTMTERFYENPDGVRFLRRLMLDEPHPQRPEGFARQLRAIAGFDVRDRLGALDLPVHVIGAEHDVLVPVWKSQELAELIPGAQLTVLPGLAHGANIEAPEAFNAAVLDWLAAQAATTA